MKRSRPSFVALLVLVACAAGALVWRHLALWPRHLPVAVEALDESFGDQAVAVEGALTAEDAQGRRQMVSPFDRWRERAVEVRGLSLPVGYQVNAVVRGTYRVTVDDDGRRVCRIEAESAAASGGARWPRGARSAETLFTVVAVVPASVGCFIGYRRARCGRDRDLRRRRAYLGLCLACGYDLRASRGRCPECGEESERR